MKNQNENLVKIAKSVINNLSIRSYIESSKSYRNQSNEDMFTCLIKREVLSLATNDHEQTYLFVNRVMKQINLLLE